jgi:hypothetical protein
MQQASSTRTPMGDMVSRKMTSLELQQTMPGAEEGEYAVISYTIAMTFKPQGEEILTLMKESDGTWKAAAYSIK